MDENILAAVQIIREAGGAVALTGAGISTPSGIPDFRSPNSGLWDQVDASEVASLSSFRTNPGVFYGWIRPLARLILAAQPNAAHDALARMEQRGWLSGIITQNIDGLHTRAGSRHVIEVHGHLREATCIRCFEVYDTAPYMRPFLDTGEIPRCPACGGVLKPNVILFGEQLPIKELAAARKTASRCKVMLVAGSSIEVAPACDLPVEAWRHGASVIIINLGNTPVDDIAKVTIHDNVATVLPQIADLLEAK